MSRFVAFFLATIAFFVGISLGFFIPELSSDVSAVVATPTPDAITVDKHRFSTLSTVLKEVAAVPSTDGILARSSGEANRLCRPDDGAVIAGDIESNELLLIVGNDETGRYRRLSDGTWVASFLVEPLLIDMPIMDEMSLVDWDWSKLRLVTRRQLAQEAEVVEQEVGKSTGLDSATTQETSATPTITPTPLPLPTGEVSPATVDYANELLAASDILTQTGLDDAIRRGGLEALAIEWLLTIRRQLILLEEQSERLQEISMPAELTGVYDRFDVAVDQCEQAAKLLTSGLESADLLALEEGLRTYQSCRQGLNETTQIIRTYADDWAVSDLPIFPLPDATSATETPAP